MCCLHSAPAEYPLGRAACGEVLQARVLEDHGRWNIQGEQTVGGNDRDSAGGNDRGGRAKQRGRRLDRDQAGNQQECTTTLVGA